MATLDDLAKSNQEAVKLLGEIVKFMAKAGGAPGAEPRYAGKSGTAWAGFQQLRAGQNMGMSGLAKGAMGGGWGAAGGAGGSLSMMGKVGLVGGVITELAKLPFHLIKFADGLHQANKAFADVSPSMAAVMAVSDMRDMMREMRQGEQLSGGAKRLADARGQYRDQVAPLETWWQKTKNEFGERHFRGMARILEWTGLGKKAEEQLNKDEKGGNKIDLNDPTGWITEIDEWNRGEQQKIADRRQPVRDVRQNQEHEDMGLAMARRQRAIRRAGGNPF